MKLNKILNLFLGATIAFSAFFTSNHLQKPRISQTLSNNQNQSDLISNVDNLNPDVQYILSTTKNENTIFLDDNFSSLYFSNLVDNFGNNTHGTCSYVAIGMLLSFYDSYWNDNLIPESYDKSSNYQYVISPTYDYEYPSFDALSPGIESEEWNDVFNLTKSEYLTFVNQNESTHFQSKLIKLSQAYFGTAKFESSINPYGMSFTEILEFLNYYLADYRGLTTSNFSIDSENTNSNLARLFAISKITDGVPVLLRVSSPSLGCHALIAYDYNSYNDEIYVHPGWMDDEGKSLTHVSLSSLGFNNIVDAISLEIDSSHVHSNNYHSSRNINVCSCMYSFPQDVYIASGNYRDMTPTFKWKSLYNEKWFEQYNPYFKLSILNSNQTTFLTINNISQKEYTLSSSDWENILYNLSGNTYYCYLELASDTSNDWDDYGYLKSFTKPKEYYDTPYIDPNEYGFEDAYPTDDNTKNNFISHNVRGLLFETRRYRTGYIHDEYVVMSPIRAGINEAFIEYKFASPITRIDVQLSHWREYSYEWLNSSTGTATIDAFINGEWVTQLDLLSTSTNLPTNRNYPNFYQVAFTTPICSFRFHSSSYGTNTNNNNRGRICIGKIAVYPKENSANISDQSSSFSNANLIVFEGNHVESFQSSTDVDYFKYYATYTNYIQFNIQSMWHSDLCNIEVYLSTNLSIPLYSYTNNDFISGDNSVNLPSFYADQGEIYYFKVYKTNVSIYNSKAYYTAKVLSGNHADCEPDQYLANGYISDLNYVYNGSNNIYIYFDSTTYSTNSSGITYRSIVQDAMLVWNKVGIIQWVEVFDSNSADTTVLCVYEPTKSSTGVYTSSFNKETKIVNKGSLKLNTYHQYTFTYLKSLKTCIHELGHGLGLGHIDYDRLNNVMYSYAGEYKGQLGQGDLAAYRYLWG